MKYTLRMYVEDRRILTFVGDAQSADVLFKTLVCTTERPSEHWSVIVTYEPKTWERSGAKGGSYVVSSYQHPRGTDVLLHRNQ